MDEDKVSLPINLPQILLLVAVAANLFWLPAVLKSSRPQEHAAFEATGNEPLVDARLWQDPFEATARLRT
jgi:hypothetical protein